MVVSSSVNVALVHLGNIPLLILNGGITHRDTVPRRIARIAPSNVHVGTVVVESNHQVEPVRSKPLRLINEIVWLPLCMHFLLQAEHDATLFRSLCRGLVTFVGVAESFYLFWVGRPGTIVWWMLAP